MALSPCPRAVARARSIASATGRISRAATRSAVPSPASARSARSRTDCRKSIVCRPARSQPSRATHQPPKRRPSSGCRTIGAPRRSSPSSARSRPRPGTTSSTCSTRSPPRCSRRPTRPRRRRACASLRDLDAAALRLRDVGNVILNEATPDQEVRAAVFALIGRDALSAVVGRIGALAEPHDDTYFAELSKHHRKIRYAPALLAGLDLGAAPAVRPRLDAVEYLRG